MDRLDAVLVGLAGVLSPDLPGASISLPKISPPAGPLPGVARSARAALWGLSRGAGKPESPEQEGVYGDQEART